MNPLDKFNPAINIPGKSVAVKVQPSQSIEKAIRHFKMLFKNSGRVEELKERQQFVSKSSKRRQVIETAKFDQMLKNKRSK